MRTIRAALAILLLVPVARADFPDDAKLVVTLQVETDDGGKLTAKLAVRNDGPDPLTVRHPADRQVVTFVVMNHLGNILAPVGRAKVDAMRNEDQRLPTDGVVRHDFDKMEFLTGSALFGYDLEPGVAYRAIAVYRPAGPAGPGFCSKEVKFTAK